MHSEEGKWQVQEITERKERIFIMKKLNYEVLKENGYKGYVLKDAPEKVLQFGEGNFMRAFVDYFVDVMNEKAGFNGKVVWFSRSGMWKEDSD